MATSKITQFTEDTSPTSDDLVPTVHDPAGTPVNRKVTASNLITKAHGLSNGIVKVATGTMAAAVAGTDYAPATSGTAILKGSGSGGFSNAVQGTDYYAPSGTDVAVVDGGTGASSASAARVNLLPSYASNTLRVLRVNAGETDVEWASVSGGQSAYDAIVAPSGGDYTTLGAALAAATAGWCIFVKAGTYVESAISTSLANLTIIGEGYNTSIISHSSNVIDFSGSNVLIQNMQFTGTTGRLVMSNNEYRLINNRFNYSGIAAASGSLVLSGNSGLCAENFFTNSNASNATISCILISGSWTRFVANHVFANARSTTNNTGILAVTGADNVIANNIFRGLGTMRADGYGIFVAASRVVISGNHMVDFTTTTSVAIAIYVATSQTGINITGNTIHQGAVSIFLCNFTGNTVVAGTTANAWVYLNVANINFTNNTLQGQGTASSSGISVNANAINISSNTIINFPIGIDMVSSSRNDMVVAANHFPSCTTPISGTSAESTVMNNSYTQPSQDSRTVYATNTSGGTLTAGSVVILKSVASGNEITTTTTVGDDKVYGVVMNSPANNALGRVQTLGKVTSLRVNGVTDIAIGDFLSTYSVAGVAAKASAGDMVFAIALEAYTTDDSNGVLDALLISPRLI